MKAHDTQLMKIGEYLKHPLERVRVDYNLRLEKAEEIDDASGFETDNDLCPKWLLRIRLLEQLELEYTKDFNVAPEQKVSHKNLT